MKETNQVNHSQSLFHLTLSLNKVLLPRTAKALSCQLLIPDQEQEGHATTKRRNERDQQHACATNSSEEWICIDRTEPRQLEQTSTVVSFDFETRLHMIHVFHKVQRLQFVVHLHDQVDYGCGVAFASSSIIQFNDLIFHHASSSDEDIDMGREDDCHLIELFSIALDNDRASNNKIRKHSPVGFLRVNTVETSTGHDIVRLSLSARHLPITDCIMDHSSDPYLTIEKEISSANQSLLVEVARTSVMRRTCDPDWEDIVISVLNLCDDEFNKPVVISIWDWDPSSSTNELISRVRTTASYLIHNSNQGNALPMITSISRSNMNRAALSSETHVPTLMINSVSMSKGESFVSHFCPSSGGWELKLMLGVDFSSNDGEPGTSFSAHSPIDTENNYLRTIEQIASVIFPYNHSKEAHMLGFGTQLFTEEEKDKSFKAMLNHSSDQSDLPIDCISDLTSSENDDAHHVFPCGGSLLNAPSNEQDSIIRDIQSVNDIVNNYKVTLQRVSSHTPMKVEIVSDGSYYAPVLSKMLDIVEREVAGKQRRKRQGKKVYYTIFMLVGETFLDTKQTLSQLIRSSKLPVSIIFVGVRNDLNETESLSSSEIPVDTFQKVKQVVNSSGRNLLRDGSSYAQRANLTFVEVSNDSNRQSIEGRTLLSSIPQQFMSYRSSNAAMHKPNISQPKKQRQIQNATIKLIIL